MQHESDARLSEFVSLRSLLAPFGPLSLTAGSLHAATALRIGSAQVSIASIPVVVAIEQKLFEAEGINAEIVDFDGGGPGRAGAGRRRHRSLHLRRRSCACGWRAAVSAARCWWRCSTSIHIRCSRRVNSPATDLASLRGKAVGITSPGSLTDNTLRFMIRKLGLNPDSDYEILAAGTGASMRAAIERGSVVAGMFTTPDVQAYMATGKYKFVADFRDLDYMALDLIAVGSWLKANDATAHAVARAIVKAEKLIQTDPKVVEAAVHDRFPTLIAGACGHRCARCSRAQPLA